MTFLPCFTVQFKFHGKSKCKQMGNIWEELFQSSLQIINQRRLLANSTPVYCLQHKIKFKYFALDISSSLQVYISIVFVLIY